jgi:hypothetical protein
MKMFYYKIQRYGTETILAVCDKGIIGKRFEDGELVLDVKEEFYCDEECGEEVIELFDQATIINLVGNKIVSLAIEKGWVEKENVLTIKGVMHAQIIKI